MTASPRLLAAAALVLAAASFSAPPLHGPVKAVVASWTRPAPGALPTRNVGWPPARPDAFSPLPRTGPADHVATDPAGLPAPAGVPASAVGTRSAPAPGVSPRLRGRWQWPLAPTPEIVQRFRAPRSAWGAGHRGLDLAPTGRTVTSGAGLTRGMEPGTQVLAVATGRVTHAGTIAGRGTVSVLHPSGLRSTYEPLVPSVRVGQQVGQGQQIGALAPSASHCGDRTCLHLGALRGRAYLDPLILLRGGPVVLLPPR